MTADSLDDWRAWERWQIVDALAPYLPEALVEQNFSFYGRTLGHPRAAGALEAGRLAGRGRAGRGRRAHLRRRAFPAGRKARAEELVANLLEAYHQSISKLDWMTDATRAEALKKLSSSAPRSATRTAGVTTRRSR